MTAKEFLNQALYLDKQIENKIEQIEILNVLSTKATSVLSDMPKTKNNKSTKLEDTVVKIVDLQESINLDIQKLLEVKKQIRKVINTIPDKEEQTILEQRYLCFKNWEQIAVNMNYSIQYCFKVHKRALKNISQLIKTVE